MTGLLRAAWRHLTSMRTALVLLFLLAVAAIPGSLLPQDEYRLVFTYRRNNRAVDPDSDVLSEAGDSAPEEVSHTGYRASFRQMRPCAP